MYDPVKDGVAVGVEGVDYVEVAPPTACADVVHCFWELRADAELDDDVTLHAMPDACVNVLLNPLDPPVAGVTMLHTEFLELSLGRRFHYAGIQFFPGVWRGDPDETVDHFVGEPYGGVLPLEPLGRAIAEDGFDAAILELVAFVETLRDDGVVEPNPITTAILTHLDEIHSVADMAEAAHLSPRQLQRTLKDSTGFAPHDFLKVLRIQQSFRRDELLMFADQAHFTHSFKRVTGLTPGAFAATFGGRSA